MSPKDETAVDALTRHEQGAFSNPVAPARTWSAAIEENISKKAANLLIMLVVILGSPEKLDCNVRTALRLFNNCSRRLLSTLLTVYALKLERSSSIRFSISMAEKMSPRQYEDYIQVLPADRNALRKECAASKEQWGFILMHSLFAGVQRDDNMSKV